jgi:hypothetical protein
MKQHEATKTGFHQQQQGKFLPNMWMNWWFQLLVSRRKRHTQSTNWSFSLKAGARIDVNTCRCALISQCNQNQRQEKAKTSVAFTQKLVSST